MTVLCTQVSQEIKPLAVWWCLKIGICSTSQNSSQQHPRWVCSSLATTAAACFSVVAAFFAGSLGWSPPALAARLPVDADPSVTVTRDVQLLLSVSPLCPEVLWGGISNSSQTITTAINSVRSSLYWCEIGTPVACIACHTLLCWVLNSSDPLQMQYLQIAIPARFMSWSRICLKWIRPIYSMYNGCNVHVRYPDDSQPHH